MTFTHSIDKNVISLIGDLIDRKHAEQMVIDIDAMIAAQNNKIVFDLGRLKYINSSGLTVLINALTKARKSGGEAMIANVSKKVNELLVITKLNTVFTVTDTIEEALKKIS